MGWYHLDRLPSWILGKCKNPFVTIIMPTTNKLSKQRAVLISVIEEQFKSKAASSLLCASKLSESDFFQIIDWMNLLDLYTNRSLICETALINNILLTVDNKQVTNTLNMTCWKDWGCLINLAYLKGFSCCIVMKKHLKMSFLAAESIMDQPTLLLNLYLTPVDQVHKHCAKNFHPSTGWRRIVRKEVGNCVPLHKWINSLQELESGWWWERNAGHWHSPQKVAWYMYEICWGIPRGILFKISY